MKNIHKLADEIFKAPTIKELIQRHKSTVTEVVTPGEIGDLAKVWALPKKNLIIDRIVKPIEDFVRKEKTYIVTEHDTLESIYQLLKWKTGNSAIHRVNHPELPWHTIYESTDGTALFWAKETSSNSNVLFLHESIFK